MRKDQIFGARMNSGLKKDLEAIDYSTNSDFFYYILYCRISESFEFLNLPLNKITDLLFQCVRQSRD
jgi:hypothetical protein